MSSTAHPGTDLVQVQIALSLIRLVLLQWVLSLWVRSIMTTTFNKYVLWFICLRLNERNSWITLTILFFKVSFLIFMFEVIQNHKVLDQPAKPLQVPLKDAQIQRFSFIICYSDTVVERVSVIPLGVFFVLWHVRTFWIKHGLKAWLLLPAPVVCSQEICRINGSKNPHCHQLIEINSLHPRECPFPQNKWGINSSFRQGSPLL